MPNTASGTADIQDLDQDGPLWKQYNAVAESTEYNNVTDLRFLVQVPGAASISTHTSYSVLDGVAEQGEDGRLQIRVDDEDRLLELTNNQGRPALRLRFTGVLQHIRFHSPTEYVMELQISRHANRIMIVSERKTDVMRNIALESLVTVEAKFGFIEPRTGQPHFRGVNVDVLVEGPGISFAFSLNGSSVFRHENGQAQQSLRHQRLGNAATAPPARTPADPGTVSGEAMGSSSRQAERQQDHTPTPIPASTPGYAPANLPPPAIPTVRVLLPVPGLPAEGPIQSNSPQASPSLGVPRPSPSGTQPPHGPSTATGSEELPALRQSSGAVQGSNSMNQASVNQGLERLTAINDLAPQELPDNPQAEAPSPVTPAQIEAALLPPVASSNHPSIMPMEPPSINPSNNTGTEDFLLSPPPNFEHPPTYREGRGSRYRQAFIHHPPTRRERSFQLGGRRSPPAPPYSGPSSSRGPARGARSFSRGPSGSQSSIFPTFSVFGEAFIDLTGVSDDEHHLPPGGSLSSSTARAGGGLLSRSREDEPDDGNPTSPKRARTGGRDTWEEGDDDNGNNDSA